MVVSVSGQSTKYDTAGNLTFIDRLLGDPTGCEPARSFTGRVSKVESFPGDNADAWEFVLAIPRSKAQKFQVSLSLDAGAVVVDLDELLQPGRRIRVTARQCGSGGFWTVDAIGRV